VNTNHRVARYDAPSVNKVAVAFVLALVVALLTIMATGQRSEAGILDPAVTLTVDQTEVGFGAAMVDGTVLTRTITVTNTGSEPIIIGGVKFEGDAGEILDFATDIDPTTGLKIDGGGKNTFVVEFDPSVEGTREATLTLLEGLLDGAILTLTGETINLVNETGETVQGVDLSGTGTTNPPGSQPGVQSDCTITGTNQGEALTGTPSPDVICGLGGNDRINGLANNDVMRGGTGRDRILDKAGLDKLFGQGGGDTLNAKDGGRRDVLKGGGGKDRIIKDRKDRGKA
jgi:Ca2+-binding RTX toxin-like protein